MQRTRSSFGAVSSGSSKPTRSKHRVALRIFWSVTGALIAASLVPAIPVAAKPVVPSPGVASAPASSYTPVTPVRLMDTRDGTGGVPVAKVGAGGTVDLTVTGAPPLAPVTATAVVLNVTVTNTSVASFLTIYGAGSTRPNISNLNWVGGKTIPNLVMVAVGNAGKVTFYNQFGTTDVVADLEGYFQAPSGLAGGEVALTPYRIADTRDGTGGVPVAKVGPGGVLDIQVTGTGGAGGIPATGVSGAILNVTVTNTTAASFLTVWPKGATRNTVSNLNWVAGLTIPNRVFVPVGTGGKISVYNVFGSTDVVVDVSGYFTDATRSGELFTPTIPVRLEDTRSDGKTLPPNTSFTLQITGGGVAGVPPGATAAMLNVTATDTTAASFLTVYPSTSSRPLASDLNWTAGVTIPNLTVATIGTTGAVNFYNSAGAVDVVVDLFGYFGAASGPATTVTVTATPSTLQADGASTSTVTATVKDASSIPVAGDTVTFTETPSVAGACGPLSSTTGTTNALGQVTTTYTASTVAGTCTITATETGGKFGTAGITQTTPVDTVTIVCTTPATSDATPSTCTLPATGASNFTLKVTVKKLGVAQSGDAILLTSSASPTGACGTFTTAGSTDAFGVFTSLYTSSTTVGTCAITAHEANTSQSASTTVTQTKPKNIVTVTCVSNSINVSTSTTPSSTVCTANVQDFSGANVSGDTVTFSLSGTPPAACGTIAPTSGTTDASGNLAATYTASATSGFCTLTATESGTGATGTTVIDQLKSPAPANSPYVVTVDCSTDGGTTFNTGTCNVPADGVKTVIFRATVRDTLAAPVSGDPISWTVTGPSGCGTVSPATGFSDASGQATTLYKATLTVGITCKVTATEAFTGANQFAFANQTAVPDKITITATPSTVTANGSSTSTVRATVTDGVTGAPVAGDVITFSASGNPAAACGNPGDGLSTTATTNASGVATFTYIASTTSGFCTITAEDIIGTSADDDLGGNAASTTITQTLSPAPSNGPFTVKIVLLNPENGLAQSSAPRGGDIMVTAQVIDNAGKVVAADPTSFTLDSGGGCHIENSPNGLTNSHGKDSAEIISESPDLITPTCTVTVTESQTGASGSATMTNTGVLNEIGVDDTTNCSSPRSDNYACSIAVSTTTSSNSMSFTFFVDNENGAVANDQVTYTLTPNPAGACGTMVNSTNGGKTDADGLVTSTYVASTTVGNCILRATEAATGNTTHATEADIWISQQASAPPITILNVTCAVDADPTAACTFDSLLGDGTSTATITATVTESDGTTPRAGDPINFLIDDPKDECGTLTVASAVTDAAGKATTKLISHKYDGDSSHSATMTCSVFVVEAEGFNHFLQDVAQDIPANTVTVTCNGASACTLPADGTSTGALVATVKDGITGAPVVGDTIAWTTSADPACSATLTPTASQTNSSGQATSTYLSSTTTGFCTITATDPSSNYSTGGSPGSQPSPSGTVLITETVPPAKPRKV